MKRIVISFALAVFAIASLAVPAAFADESSGYGEYRNPLYPDAALRPLPAGMDPDGMDVTRSAAEYLSESDAAAALLGMMKERKEDILLYVSSKNANARALFTGIFEAALAHTGDPKGGDYIRWTYAGYLFSYTSAKGSDGCIDYAFGVSVSYYTSQEQERELDAAVEELLGRLGLSGMTEYKKILAIYDYITSNVAYDDAGLEDESNYTKYTAYAALVKGTAVCQGYAALFYRLALESGVDARMVYGMGGGDMHSWNIAGILGTYYLLDPTWDAGRGEYWYFLKGSDDFPAHDAYSDFLPRYDVSAEDYHDVVAEGACGDDLTWTLVRAGILTVGGGGDMAPYGGDAPWSAWSGRITAVEIEDGVTNVCAGAFADCPALEDVSIGAGVASIGEGAFPETVAKLRVECLSYAQAWAKEQGYGNLADDPALSRGYIARGHRNVEALGAVEPSCTEDGLTEGSVCLDCGDTVRAQQVVPATGHTEEIDPAAGPTCTENGITEGAHCAVCGEILVPQETVPATGHAEEIDEGTAPTCTEDGITEGIHCAVCGEILVPQETVPAPGHDWQVVYDADRAAGTVTARRTCRRDASHTETETRSVSFVTLPAGLTRVTEEVLRNTAFTAIVIPEGATGIGDMAFANCPGLQYVRIPASVTEISPSAFDGSENAWIDRAE